MWDAARHFKPSHLPRGAISNRKSEFYLSEGGRNEFRRPCVLLAAADGFNTYFFVSFDVMCRCVFHSDKQQQGASVTSRPPQRSCTQFLLRSIPQWREVQFNCKRWRTTSTVGFDGLFFWISAFRLLISLRRGNVKPHCWSWLADGLQSLSFIQGWGVVTVWRLENHQRTAWSQRGETSWKAQRVYQSAPEPSEAVTVLLSWLNEKLHVQSDFLKKTFKDWWDFY